MEHKLRAMNAMPCGSVCPYCGIRGQLVKNGPVDARLACIAFEVDCQECGRTHVQVWRLSDIRTVAEDEEQAVAEYRGRE